MSETSQVEWNEVKRVAKLIFDVWGSGSDYIWAEKAWQELTTAGLTRYSTNEERYRVIVRLLALGTLCKDFCSVAWEEFYGYRASEWARELTLNPFKIGCLIGSRGLAYLDRYPDDDPEEGEMHALGVLIDTARREVVHALQESLGGDIKLYEFSCWINSYEIEDDDEVDGMKLEAGEPFSPQRAFSWIADGCPPLG